MSNALLNWHVEAGQPFGEHETLVSIADEAGFLLMGLTNLIQAIDTQDAAQVQRTLEQLYKQYKDAVGA